MIKTEVENHEILLMFPGVGSQYRGMGKEFHENFKVVRETFEEASDVLGFDFKELCFSPDTDLELGLLEYSKPALVCIAVAFYKVLVSEFGIFYKYSIGYSLGEYSALCCAGIIKFSDALQLVRQRALVINEISAEVEGTMAWVVGIDSGLVEKLCEDSRNKKYEIYISAYQSPRRMSISGSWESIQYLAKEIEDQGGIVMPVKIGGPFHCPLMKKASKKLETILEKYDFNVSDSIIIANRTALPYDYKKQSIIANLAMQLTEPIRWCNSIEYLLTCGIQMSVEVGPKEVLKHLLEINTNTVRIFSFENSKNFDTLKEALIPGRKA